MSAPRESHHPDDFVILTVDIDDCPIVELALTEIYDVDASRLKDDYLATLRNYVTQQLEDTTWLEDQSVSPLFDAGFATYHRKPTGSILSLRKPALSRLIDQTLRGRIEANTPISISILIRFLIPESELPTRNNRTPTVPSMVGGPADGVSGAGSLVDLSDTRSAVPPGISPADSEVAPTDLHFGENNRTPPDAANNTPTSGPTFRGLPIRMDTAPGGGPTAGNSSGTPQRHTAREPDDARLRNRAIGFQQRDVMDGTPRTQTTHQSGRTSTSHPTTLRYGSETFEDYMQQFMSSEVKYKDFRKATFQKFDSGRQDSFIHWYKLFCATCLQWGLWCPPYESVEEDNIHGCWWTLLPASVRAQESFMSSLLYGVLSLDSVFPFGTREHSAIQGCTANAGYDAIYSLLRLHHPKLQSVIHTINEIPRQRRAETFSIYLRRLHDFMARERIAGRNYTESEALDLSVRNLTTEWRSEFRRLVERDRRSGRHAGDLPFHLTMSQLATTFMQYSTEIGRDTPSLAAASGLPRERYVSNPNTHTIRRIEAAPPTSEFLHGTDSSLGEDEINLLVHAMALDQATSTTCVGCHQPGHSLTDCNRFVDYIVAQSLARRHPKLRDQVAASHTQFRRRINNSSGRAPPRSPAIRQLVSSDGTHSPTTPDPFPSPDLTPSPMVDDVEDPASPDGYQLNALRGAFASDPAGDFETCFAYVDTSSCTLPPATSPYFDSVLATHFHLSAKDAAPSPLLRFDHDSFLLRRLAETYDATSRAVFAHADNGSMACTTSDATLLYSYRPLAARHSKVRLFDAGSHPHHPTGVGFLRVPAYRLPSHTVDGLAPPDTTLLPCSVFVRTYHTATIPGVIISHCAIAKQLATAGYSMTSSEDTAGFIRFPHRAPSATSTDTFVRLQPTRLRGGLTFTDPLYIPTAADHLAVLPCTPDRYVVNSLATSVAPVPLHFPPAASLAPYPLQTLDDFPEFAPTAPLTLTVNSLTRSALRMLWHQRLGHLNFRKLSELHRHTRGVPMVSMPSDID